MMIDQNRFTVELISHFHQSTADATRTALLGDQSAEAVFTFFESINVPYWQQFHLLVKIDPEAPEFNLDHPFFAKLIKNVAPVAAEPLFLSEIIKYDRHKGIIEALLFSPEEQTKKIPNPGAATSLLKQLQSPLINFLILLRWKAQPR